MFVFWFKVHVWFEFVDSESNYADGISRDWLGTPFASPFMSSPGSAKSNLGSGKNYCVQYWLASREQRWGIVGASQSSIG